MNEVVKAKLNEMQRQYEEGGIESVDRTLQVTGYEYVKMVTGESDWFIRSSNHYAKLDTLLTDFGPLFVRITDGDGYHYLSKGQPHYDQNAIHQAG